MPIGQVMVMSAIVKCSHISSCECKKVVSAIAAISQPILMQHLVTRMQNPELFLQEPLTQGLTLYVAHILQIYDKWQLLQIRLSCIHMTTCFQEKEPFLI